MQKKTDSLRAKLIFFALRLVPAFVSCILFFYFISPVFIAGHLKLFQNQIRLLHPEYEILHKAIVKINQLDYIEFHIKVNKQPTLPDSSVGKGAILRIKGQASTICIPPIIMFSLILAWPGMPVKKRCYAVLVAIPMMILLSAFDYPLIFISDIESVFTDAPIMNQIRSLWKHLMNNGGRQFLALIIGGGSLGIVAWASQHKKIAEPGKVGRNDPCPCGSGKKYKNCCLEP